MFKPSISAVLAAWALTFLLPAGGHCETAWPERSFNPHPLADDLILPMPCGGSMVFRRVEVPAEGALGDVRIVLGGTDDRFGLFESNRADYVAGAFADPKHPSRQFFYISKYKTTASQFQSITGPCPEVKDAPPLPVTAVSWFEAVQFAQNYTDWLVKNAAARLPKSGDSQSFIRLPTETEWEYAARGGAAVSVSEFQETRFPMSEPLQSYAWFQGTQSANGKVQPLGLLLPNPLGLFDILGNVDEIVSEPFRATMRGRLHGQSGGYIVKGGNFLTSEADIRASYRQEVMPFDARGTRHVKTVGFRVALSAIVVSSANRLKELKSAWERMAEDKAVPTVESSLSDPVSELSQIIGATTDPQQRKVLERLGASLAANIAARNEQRDRSAKGLLRLGAFIGRKLSDDCRQVRVLETLFEGREKAGWDETARRASAQRLESARLALSDNLTYYLDNLTVATHEYPVEILESQLKVLNAELSNRKLESLQVFSQMFLGYAKELARGVVLDRQKLLDDLSRSSSK